MSSVRVTTYGYPRLFGVTSTFATEIRSSLALYIRSCHSITVDMLKFDVCKCSEMFAWYVSSPLLLGIVLCSRFSNMVHFCVCGLSTKLKGFCKGCVQGNARPFDAAMGSIDAWHGQAGMPFFDFWETEVCCDIEQCLYSSATVDQAPQT